MTDGWAAYPNSIRRAFREKVKKVAGVGRTCLEVWPSDARLIHASMRDWRTSPSQHIEFIGLRAA